MEVLKEQARHMQRKIPKPKKKPKKAVIKGGKQKNKYRKPQPTEICQPEKAKGAQTEGPRSNNNSKIRRNQRNRQRRNKRSN